MICGAASKEGDAKHRGKSHQKPKLAVKKTKTACNTTIYYLNLSETQNSQQATDRHTMGPRATV